MKFAVRVFLLVAISRRNSFERDFRISNKGGVQEFEIPDICQRQIPGRRRGTKKKVPLAAGMTIMERPR